MPGYLKTYRIPVPKHLYLRCRELMQYSGRVYSKTVSVIKKMHRKKGIWLSLNTMQKYIKFWARDIPLHSQTKQALVERYFDALKGFFEARNKNPDVKPPFRTRKFYPVIWKNQAVKLLKDGTIRLAAVNKQEPLYIKTNLPSDLDIRQVTLVFDKKARKYFLHVSVAVQTKEVISGNNVAGVDLGVIHPMVVAAEDKTLIFNGGVLNAKIQYRNKKLAEFQQKLAKKKKGSRRYKKLRRAMTRLLYRISANQVDDILHKYTTYLVGWCVENGINTLAVGDPRGIRERVQYSAKSNQKIHGWMFRRIIEMLKYKAQAFGIKVVLKEESYTSQTCPVCGERTKTSNRNFRCKNCGFEAHRDAVGAFNIRAKYTGGSLVVGFLAYPAGVRYNSHLRCPVAMWSPWKPTSEWARTS